MDQLSLSASSFSLIIAAFFFAVCWIFSPICRMRLFSAVVTSLALPLLPSALAVVLPDGVLPDVLLVPAGLPPLEDGWLEVEAGGDSCVFGLE